MELIKFLLMKKLLNDSPMKGSITNYSISVDAGSSKVYEKVRRPGKWEILLDNLEWLKLNKNNARVLARTGKSPVAGLSVRRSRRVALTWYGMSEKLVTTDSESGQGLELLAGASRAMRSTSSAGRSRS